MNHRFLSPAKQELAEAVEFYEAAVPGLGLEFLNEVERTIARRNASDLSAKVLGTFAG